MKERPPSGSDSGERGSMVTQGYSAASALSSDGSLSSSQPIPPHDSHYHDQAQFEADKRAVYKHPLFPLLALLFEKCEIATQTSPESAMSDSFHHDLEAFVQHQERDRKPFLANDAEVDGLMIKAIQVLRIHLLELDKVQELCKDFCTRYISHSNSPHNSCYSSNGDTPVSPTPTGNVFHHAGLPFSAAQSSIPPVLMNNCNASPEHSTGSSHHSSNSPTLGSIHGGTPLSQIGVGANNSIPPGPTTSNSQDSFLQAPNSPSSGEEEEDYLGRKKTKRGVLPKHATTIMRSWLFQHIVHPYPTEDEKREDEYYSQCWMHQILNFQRQRQLKIKLHNYETRTYLKLKYYYLQAKKLKTNGSKPALKYWSDNLATMGSGSESGGVDVGHNPGDELTDDSDGDSSNDNDDANDDLLIDNSDSSQQ
ncbi:Homeobox protein PKNOX2 [Folsomia candida]|uniref:Homeobox protein PKNOX2 n=1 Tax=Folsomia candida TaxID=158441 RepID=A0A226EU23_FOLCA|nr:Homeobox protein PKNOX2 [Folsomia candida]